MKALMVWAALGGLLSACALAVEEPGELGQEPPSGGLPLPPSMPPPGGFGGGGTGEEPWTARGVGGAGALPRPPREGAGGTRDSSPSCFSNEDCSAGLCVNGECRAFCAGDAGCAEGDACVLGVCRPDAGRGWECVEQGDCDESEDCVGGNCLRRCLRDGHCSEGERVCSFGYCGLLR